MNVYSVFHIYWVNLFVCQLVSIVFHVWANFVFFFIMGWSWTDLLYYDVDVSQEKVTVRGRVDPKKRMQRIRSIANSEKRRKAIEFERQPRGQRLNDSENKCCSSRWTLKSTNNTFQRACCFYGALDLVASSCCRCIDLITSFLVDNIRGSDHIGCS